MCVSYSSFESSMQSFHVNSRCTLCGKSWLAEAPSFCKCCPTFIRMLLYHQNATCVLILYYPRFPMVCNDLRVCYSLWRMVGTRSFRPFSELRGSWELIFRGCEHERDTFFVFFPIFFSSAWFFEFVCVSWIVEELTKHEIVLKPDLESKTCPNTLLPDLEGLECSERAENLINRKREEKNCQLWTSFTTI